MSNGREVETELRKFEDGRGGFVSASLLRPNGWGDRDGDRTAIVLAHGAGAGMDHPFMTSMQQRLVDRGYAVLLFNFPYKERGGRAPDRSAVLEDCYKSVVEQARRELSPCRLLIGGKSMGGRMATRIVADGFAAAGIILLGYPLHPPGKPDRMRREHLPRISVPMLFLQGTRDSLCNLDDLREVLDDLKAPTELYVIEGGDHSFKVPKRSGRTEEEILDELADRCGHWIERIKAQK